ncbi:MAG: TonB-dependent receptor [Pseudomonadota bacterium]|nr:TonB-dependent receptor [Pseudomonadota bacterium]
MSSQFKSLPIALLIFGSLPAFSSTTTELNKLVVTSSRLDSVELLPANITILDSVDIANSPANTLPELLAQQVGINTNSFSSHSNTASVGIRSSGSTATQNTLILLDGRRLNDIDLSSVNFAAIPIENIERIEIVRGSGSVLYGDGATGGIINIITKNPSDSSPHAMIKTTVGSFNHKEINGSATYSTDDFGLTANINSLKDDGYRDHNNFDLDSGQINLRVPTELGEVYFKLGGYTQQQQLPGERQIDLANNINQLITDPKGTNTPRNWADENTVFATLGYSHSFNATDSFIIDTNLRQKQQNSQFFTSYNSTFTATELDTWSITPRFNFTRDIYSLPANWTVGSDIYIYDYTSNRANLQQNQNTPIHKIDVDQKNVALYAQGIVTLNSLTSMTLGWRTQRVQQTARDNFNASAPGFSYGSKAPDFKQTDYENSYEIGLKHALNDNFDIYGRLGRSLRFGTVDDLFEYNDSFQQVFSALDPQTSNDRELGLSFHNTTFESTVSYFEQEISNEIRYNPVIFQNVNLDDTKHKGIELSVATELSFIKLRANYTYLNAKFTDGTNSGKYLTLIPKDTFNVTAESKLPYEILVAVNLNYVNEAYMSNDSSNTFDQKIPSYQTVNLKLKKKINNLELALQINNLFNEKYYNYAINSTSIAGKYNAYSLPELNANISLSYAFE